MTEFARRQNAPDYHIEIIDGDEVVVTFRGRAKDELYEIFLAGCRTQNISIWDQNAARYDVKGR
jgi:hypothetical protein